MREKIGGFGRIFAVSVSALLLAGCPEPFRPCAAGLVQVGQMCLRPCIEDGMSFCSTDAGGDGQVEDVDVPLMDRETTCGAMTPTRCGDQCVNTMSSSAHCGRCGNACPNAANSTASCVAGVCGLGACIAGFANCDGNMGNGCEQAISNDPMNCGMCGIQCPAGANGTPACAMGMCTLSCSMGFRLVGSRCVGENLAPRPIAPLSLGDVTLRRPTLRWELPAGFDGATVELCRDRACTMVIETLRAVGTSARPTMDLTARSVVFWRLRGRVGEGESPALSPTWLFHVPVRDATSGVDTSFHAHNDLNGDGFDDVAIGEPGFDFAETMLASGQVRIHHGSPEGVANQPSQSVRGQEGEAVGKAVAAAGDLNGDGFGDLVVGAPGARMSVGEVRVFHGGPNGITMAPTRVLDGGARGTAFGTSLAGIGDVNGDGFADILVGIPFAQVGGNVGFSTVIMFYGSQLGVDPMLAVQIDGAAPRDGFGQRLASVGDLNGDGFGDFAISAPTAAPESRTDAGIVAVFHGTNLGIGNPVRTLVGSNVGDYFGRGLAGGADMNGDGYCDLAVGAPGRTQSGQVGAGLVAIYSGSAVGIGAVPTLQNGNERNAYLGAALAFASDINGDGFADLAVSSKNASAAAGMNVGIVAIVPGSVVGPQFGRAQVLEGRAVGEEFGVAVASPGDVNGDGYSDVVIGAGSARVGLFGEAGRVSVYLGSLGGINAIPNRTIEGASDTGRLGDALASRRWFELFQHHRSDRLRVRRRTIS